MSAFQFVIIIITDQSGLKPFDLLAQPLRKRSNTQRSRNHGMMEQLHEEWQICVGYVALPIAVQHLGGVSVLLKQYASLSLPKHTFVFTIQVWCTPTHTGVVHTDLFSHKDVWFSQYYYNLNQYALQEKKRWKCYNIKPHIYVVINCISHQLQ